MQNPGITAVNIATAALIAQFVLLAIVFVAALVVQAGTSVQPLHELPWIIFAIALITVGSLLFSDQLSTLWRPLFGNPESSGIASSSALLSTFIADIFLTLVLVGATGGSRLSPFTPLYFLLPVLAIFLRESRGRVVGYSIAVVVLFTYTLMAEAENEPPRSKLAYWFVAIAAFTLATVVGLITRR